MKNDAVTKIGNYQDTHLNQSCIPLGFTRGNYIHIYCLLCSVYFIVKCSDKSKLAIVNLL